MKQHDERPERGARSQGSDISDGMNEGMRVLSYLLSGVLVYGLLGWVGDHYLGTKFLLPLGIVLGAAAGCYVIIRRFGRLSDSSSPVTSSRVTTSPEATGPATSSADSTSPDPPKSP